MHSELVRQISLEVRLGKFRKRKVRMLVSLNLARARPDAPI